MNIFSFALLAVAAGTVAQAAQQATFHLPFKAKWGNMTLAPGDYKVVLPQVSLGVREIQLTGENAHGWILPTTTDVHELLINPSPRSYLQLQRVDGVFVVTKYQAGPNNATFSFKVPKAHANREVTTINVGGI